MIPLPPAGNFYLAGSACPTIQGADYRLVPKPCDPNGFTIDRGEKYGKNKYIQRCISTYHCRYVK